MKIDPPSVFITVLHRLIINCYSSLSNVHRSHLVVRSSTYSPAAVASYRSEPLASRCPFGSVVKMPEEQGERLIAEMREPPVYTVKELSANQYAYTKPLTTPVEELFDWDRELQELATVYGREFYLVVFRSVRKVSADSEMLYNADAQAQEEARLSGGLLKYWYGILNERRECLAMCIWASREDAVKAIHKPAHLVAMKLASAMYEMYTLERYSLKIDENLVPTFTLLGSMSS